MITVGNKVECRLYNSPEGKFYGEFWQGIVLKIDHANRYGQSVRPYLVDRATRTDIWLSRKEVVKEIK